MICREIIKKLEAIAPVNYAEKWDNVGLLVGDDSIDVKRIMIALDPSKDVIDQAIEQGCNMIITHHPLIFSPMKRITTDDFIGRRIVSMIKHGIAYYAMHTNMDIAVMAQVSANMIGINDTVVIEPTSKEDQTIGIGRCGELDSQIDLLTLANKVKEQFHLSDVRVIGELEQKVSRVAISTGSGEDFVKHALQMKADVLITGDIRHHKALDALEQGLGIIDAGHFGTERFMVEWLASRLGKELPSEISIMTAKEFTPFKIV